MKKFDAAIADYTAALAADPTMAYWLYGRGVAKRLKGDRLRGDTDVAAATKIQSDVADQFAKWGVPAAQASKDVRSSVR